MSKPTLKFDPSLLKAAVYGANDGIVTTFAVMAGVVGANLSPHIVIILGFANLFADGLSMGLGDYLGERSERKLRAQHKDTESHCLLYKKGGAPCDDTPSLPVWATGLITFISFIIAGFSPIVPFLLVSLFGFTYNQFALSLSTTALALFAIGTSRTYFMGGKWYKNGAEMLAVGMLAAGVAFLLGMVTKQFIGTSI